MDKEYILLCETTDEDYFKDTGEYAELIPIIFANKIYQFIAEYFKKLLELINTKKESIKRLDILVNEIEEKMLNSRVHYFNKKELRNDKGKKLELKKELESEAEELNKLEKKLKSFRIIILNNKGETISTLFKENLKSYSINPEDYGNQELIIEILPLFPDDIGLDKRIKTLIIDLIRNCKIIDRKEDIEKLMEELKDYPVITFLPLSNKNINSMIVGDKYSDIRIFTESSATKFKIEEKILEIDKKLFKKVDKKLTEIRQRHDEFQIDILEAKKFRIEPFISSVGEGFRQEVNDIKINEEKRKVYFLGEDFLIAYRGIEKLLLNRLPKYYDLESQEIHNDPPKEKDVVFLKIDKFFDQSSISELKGFLVSREDDIYTLIQSFYLDPFPHFRKYEILNVPSKKKIQKSITMIFISLLTEKFKYTGHKHLLYPIISLSLFNDLLSSVNESATIDRILNNVIRINENDLLNNVEFWYMILSDLQTPQKLKPSIKRKKTVILTENDKDWHFEFEGETEEIEKSQNGILYFAIILLYVSKLNEKGITFIQLRILIVKLMEWGNWESAFHELKKKQKVVNELKEKQKEIDELKKKQKKRNTDKETCQNRLLALDKYDLLKTFIENHLENDKEKYTIKRLGELNIEVNADKITLDWLKENTIN